MPAQSITRRVSTAGTASERRPADRIERRMLIDGALSGGVTGQRFPSVNPATGVISGFAPDCSAEDAHHAVAAARRAFETTSWSVDSPLRTACLRQMQATLIEHREAIRWSAITETGATWRLTEGPYLDDPIAELGRLADSLASYPMTERLIDEAARVRVWVEKRPAGVVVIRIGSCHPLRLAIRALGAALAAGCTVVLAGSPEAALTTLLLGELFAACAAVPAGVVNVLSASNSAVDRVLAAHRDVDLIAFAGSAAEGRPMMAAASRAATRVSMSLERKSAAIILPDADFSSCAEHIALMATSHSGQGAATISRVLVPEECHDTAVAALTECLAGVRYGDPADPGTWMGPLISDKRRDEVDVMVKRAVAAGARMMTGGKMVRPGYYYEPTLLTGVDHATEAAAAHVGGPVLAVVTYKDDQDAVRIANRSACGPSGVVFGSHERALAVARRVRTGRMSINGGNHLGPDRHFGCAEEQELPLESCGDLLEVYLQRRTFAARCNQ